MVGISSINNQPALQRATERVDQSLERASSGQRINSAADDAAGLAISEGISSQRTGELQAIRNAGDGVSLAQTASGTINNLVEGVQRIRELAVQSANGILTDQDRSLIQNEVDSIQEQLRSTLESTNFNGQPLFTGEDQLTFQVGPNEGDTLDVDIRNLTERLDEAGLEDLSIATQQQASQTLEIADEVLGEFTEISAQIGAVQNQFESRIDTLTESSINNAQSESRIRDADYAKELSELTQNQILEQVGIAVQAQANERPRGVLQLISQV